MSDPDPGEIFKDQYERASKHHLQTAMPHLEAAFALSQETWPDIKQHKITGRNIIVTIERKRMPEENVPEGVKICSITPDLFGVLKEEEVKELFNKAKEARTENKIPEDAELIVAMGGEEKGKLTIGGRETVPVAGTPPFCEPCQKTYNPYDEPKFCAQCGKELTPAGEPRNLTIINALYCPK
jgi:hypothetical protein